MHSEDVARCHKRQVHTVDQTVLQQGIQSVFVGGRLWTLLPPPAVRKERTRHVENCSITVCACSKM